MARSRKFSNHRTLSLWSTCVRELIASRKPQSECKWNRRELMRVRRRYRELSGRSFWSNHLRAPLHFRRKAAKRVIVARYLGVRRFRYPYSRSCRSLQSPPSICLADPRRIHTIERFVVKMKGVGVRFLVLVLSATIIIIIIIIIRHCIPPAETEGSLNAA